MALLSCADNMLFSIHKIKSISRPGLNLSNRVCPIKYRRICSRSPTLKHFSQVLSYRLGYACQILRGIHHRSGKNRSSHILGNNHINKTLISLEYSGHSAQLHSSRLYGNKDTRQDDAIEIEKAPIKGWRALLTIPNALTFTRMALTPYLGHLVLQESYELACGVFLFAGITDLLDGWVARKFPSQSTPVGSFLDPLADKFLVSTLFITLSMVNIIPVPLTVLVVARDVSLIGAAFYVRVISLPSPATFSTIFDISHQTAELKPTFISKLNTAIQLGLVVTSLSAPVFNFVDHPALHVLWYTTAATTFLSGITYIFAKGTFQVFKQRK